MSVVGEAVNVVEWNEGRCGGGLDSGTGGVKDWLVGSLKRNERKDDVKSV